MANWWDNLPPMNPIMALAQGKWNPFDPYGMNKAQTAGAAPPGMPGYTQAAQDQSAQNDLLNRANTTNPFGATTTYGKDAQGRTTVTQGFGGPLGAAMQNAQQQMANQGPLNFSGLPQLDYGQQAAQGARDAAYSQATSRLDPMFQQRESQLNTRLLNQGLDPSSEAYKNAMGDFGRERNDAYSSAQNYAFGQGLQAQGQSFNQSAMARQQMLAELLSGREDPLRQLRALQDLARQPDVQQVDGPPLLGAAIAEGNFRQGSRKLDLDEKKYQDESDADFFSGLRELLPLLAGMM